MYFKIDEIQNYMENSIHVSNTNIAYDVTFMNIRCKIQKVNLKYKTKQKKIQVYNVYILRRNTYN